MFSFAAPIAFLLAGLALPIIGFYWLKVKLRRVPVSTNLFWKQLYEEKPPRSLWQHLRHWISLAVQLLLLAMLVTAIADPFLPGQRKQARKICLIIDNSASMSVTDQAESRLANAKNKALQIVEGIRELDQVAIVTASQSAQVVVGMTSHLPSLKEAIQSISLSESAANQQSAIELANRLVGDAPNKEVILFSDEFPERENGGKASGEPKSTSELEGGIENIVLQDQDGVKELGTSREGGSGLSSLEQANEGGDAHLRWEPVGKPANNIGITQFQVRRSMVDATGYEILAAVMNASELPVEARLEISLNEVPVDVFPIRLQPGERWSRSIEKTSLQGGLVQAEITQIELGKDNDAVKPIPGTAFKGNLNALSQDDVAYALLPDRSVQNVLIVSPGNLFLRRAFEANPLVNVTYVQQAPEQWPAGHLIVLHKIVPETLPAGNVLVVDPESGSTLWELDGNISDPIVTEQDDSSPLMRHLRLDNVLVPHAKKLNFTVPSKSLASTVTGDAIYTEIANASGRSLVLCVSLEESDLAFRTAFPILVANALQWFAREDNDYHPAVVAGSIQPVTLPRDLLPEGHDMFLRSPSGSETQVALSPDDEASVNDLRLQVGPMSLCGVWELIARPKGLVDAEKLKDAPKLSDAGQEDGVGETILIKQFAVNLMNENESDVRHPETRSDLTGRSELAGVPWLSRPLWFYIAFLAGVLCVLEWFLYQRRVIS